MQNRICPNSSLIFNHSKRKIRHQAEKWLTVGGVITLATLINLIWLSFSFGYIVETNRGVNASQQVLGVLTHPFRYLQIIARTLNAYSIPWVTEMAGTSIGMTGAGLPSIYFLISFFFFALISVQKDEDIKISTWQKIILGTIFIMVFGLILTSLYAQWTPLGEEIIEGIQGRYFLPIILVIPLICSKTIKNKKLKYPTLIAQSTIVNYTIITGVLTAISILASNL